MGPFGGLAEGPGGSKEVNDVMVAQARIAIEQDRTEPPYMSVGLPMMPARPGAEQTNRR
jgi:hypothetical protein